jgi:hypothetical protein
VKIKTVLFAVFSIWAVFLQTSEICAQLNHGDIIINEIVIDPPGTDSVTGCEYVELRGLPNSFIWSLTYLDIEGDTEQNPGTINYIRSLRGLKAGANGLIVIASSTNCRAFDPNTTVILDPEFQGNNSTRNNGTNSFVIAAENLTLKRGDDLDRDNDGILDAGYIIHDGFSVSDLGDSVNDRQYAVVNLPRLPGIPATESINAVTRLCTNQQFNVKDSFYYGDLETNPDTIEYSTRTSARSANFPAGGKLTPSFNSAPCSFATYGTISGQVKSASGRGVGGAKIIITASNGDTRTGLTNPFGYFNIKNVLIGDVYSLEAEHKKLFFAPQNLHLKNERQALEFTAK